MFFSLKEFKNIVESNNNDRSMELEEGELIEGMFVGTIP